MRRRNFKPKYIDIVYSLCGSETAELQVTDFSVCESRIAELRDIVYSLCGSETAELPVTKYSLCGGGMRDLKPKLLYGSGTAKLQVLLNLLYLSGTA